GGFLLEPDKKISKFTPSADVPLAPPVNALAQSPYQELVKLLEEHAGEAHLVLILGTPDPDAISSALALEFINSLFEIDTTILCFANVSHHENRALVKRLGVKLVKYDESFDLSGFRAYSIVDSQRYHTPIDLRLHEANIEFLAFVDHHREDASPPPA